MFGSEMAHRLTQSEQEKIASVEAARPFIDQMRQYRSFLEEHMDPDFGLMDKLLAYGTIDWRAMDDVRCKSSSCSRNSRLLDYILAKDQSGGFIAALRDADQRHIANYLTADGKYSNYLDGEWPLTAKEISVIDINHGSLVDLLELTDLLSLLYSKKVINTRQKDLITSKPTSHEKNEALLGILRRRSLHDYRQTVACLRESKQNRVAEILSQGGVVVRAHAHLDGPNAPEFESEIATIIANILLESRIDQPSRILELANHKVIAAKTGQSIVLYIYCKTIEELQQLHESLTSGQLEKSTELWFNSLLNRSQKIAVSSLTFSTEELQKVLTYFKDMAPKDQTMKTTAIHWLQMEEQPSDSFVEIVFKELAECPICFDTYTEPKILPCLHSFCLKCLTAYGDDKKPGDMLACPICRQEFQVPNGGYSGLQANFLVNRIKDLYQASVPRSDQSIALCEVCEFGNDGETRSVDVDNFCIECKQRLCAKCCIMHKKFAMSRMHQIVAIKAGEKSAMKEIFKTQTSPCEVHQNEKVQLYCLTCKQVICLLCFALNHKDHKCESIEEVAEKRRNLIDKDLQAIVDKMAALKKQEVAVEKLNSELRQSVDNAELQINQVAKNLIDLINNHKNKVIQDLIEKKQSMVKELVLKRQEIESERTTMESFHQFASMLKENGTYAEVARFGDDTLQKARQLMEKESVVLTPKSAIEIRFQKSDVVSKLLTESRNMIGTVSFDQEQVVPAEIPLRIRNPLGSFSTAQRKQLVSVSRLAHIPGTGSLLGITVIQKQIFVCRLRSSTVDIFSTTTHKNVATFTVKGLKDPSDMTSCAINNCIYINGQEDFTIFKISTAGYILAQFKMTDKPSRISVDDRGCVTVTFREALCLGVYAANGSRLLNVSLPSDMRSPRNAIRLGDNKFVVCHGELGEPLHRVCELGSDGKIIRWYGGAEGSDPTLINVPVHMIKIPGDRYLVADLNNHRVHLIEDFKLVKHLLTSNDGMKIPRKLEFCDDHLFVAQDDGSILVFKVTL